MLWMKMTKHHHRLLNKLFKSLSNIIYVNSEDVATREKYSELLIKCNAYEL